MSTSPVEPFSNAVQTLEERVLRSLRHLSHGVDQYSRRLVDACALTGPQLVCLRQLQRPGAWTPSRLAREVALSQPTITGILDRLCRRGLVERVRDDLDRRRVLLRVTAQGHAMTAEAPSPLQQRLARNLAALDADEQRSLAEALERVVGMMELDAPAPPVRRPASRC